MNETLTAPPPSLDVPQLKANETDKVMVVPYWTGKGSPFPDSTIPYLFARTKEDRLLRRVFPGVEEMSLPQFIEKLGRWPLVLGFEKSTNEVMAYSFLSEYSGPTPHRKANIGFCFFRKFWGMPETRDLARLAIDWWMNKEGVEILYGTLLTWNKVAIQFSREMYFSQLCRLPKFFYTDKGSEDAILVCLDRDEFLRHYASGFGV